LSPQPTSPARPWRALGPDPLLVRDLCEALAVETLVARVLVNRGVRSTDEGRDFLEPAVAQLHDPFLLADMDKAAERVARAVREREVIVVYGDYDVDGLTATALMMQFLRYLGAEPSVFVPNRAFDGYSFTAAGVEHCKRAGARVVISVDNGTGSHGPIAEMAAAGIDVIVTDHHLPGDTLPPAYALVNPRRADCAYPFKGLAGVGVAFKLACAVANRLAEGKRRSPEMMRFLGEAMAWVALGTLADMMPLTGENRVLAARGLPAIPRSSSPGLQALCAVAEVRLASFCSEDVSFRLAPRLNAAGRLGRADISLALLTAPDAAAAAPLARELDRLNLQRRVADRELLEQAQRLLDAQPADGPLVLHGEHWPTGLLGLVAGRLVTQTGRPAVLIGGKPGSDECKGSCRSTVGFDAHAALRECDALLIAHGGHAMAAGFTVRPTDVPAFAAAFRAAWVGQCGEGTVAPPLDYDGEVLLATVSQRLVEQLERLAPFGQGNGRPVLGACGLQVVTTRRMGADGTHLDLQLSQGGATLRCVAFGRGDLAETLPRGATVDALFTPKLNRFRGRVSVEAELVDLRVVAGTVSATAS
jgi:single-stranded-DNA-specific exonuclease